MAKIGVIGGGAWGTAIGNLLASNCHEVRIWVKEQETVLEINNGKENLTYLPGIKLCGNIVATSDFNEIKDSEAIFLVSPAQFLGDTIKELASREIINSNIPLVICSKGIETKSKKLLSDIVQDIFPNNPIAALSGPNFADEIASLTPAITTIASNDLKTADQVALLLKNDKFKVYVHKDIIGVELAGALKNVIAIATGVATGLKLPISTISAILTKGIHEMALISQALGGERDTMLEACGIGDLTLTCMSEKSRNMSLGVELGKGRKLEEILAERKSVAEGVPTAKAIFEIISEKNLNCHIFSLVYRILYEGLDPKEAKFI